MAITSLVPEAIIGDPDVPPIVSHPSVYLTESLNVQPASRSENTKPSTPQEYPRSQ